MRNASSHNYWNSSFIMDVAMVQIPRSTERISSYCMNVNAKKAKCMIVLPSCRHNLASLSDKCTFNIGGMRMK